MSDPLHLPPPNAPQPRRSLAPFLIGGCTVAGLLVILACGGMFYLGTRGFGTTQEVDVEVDRLFEEFASGRAAEYYRTWITPEFERVTSEADFLNLAEICNLRLGKLESKTLSSVNWRTLNTSTQFDATYNAQFASGKGTIKVSFVKRGGDWRLFAVHVNSPELLKIAAQKPCQHCGKAYAVGAKFCPHCGKELETAEASDEP